MARPSDDPSGLPDPRWREPLHASLRLLITALVIVVADQAVKALVVSTMSFGDSIDVIGSFARITRTENTGAAFGLMRGYNIVFIAVSAAAAVAIVAFRKEIAKLGRPEQLGFALVLGGALGNLVDRARLGAVVDFIDIGLGAARFPSFNVADSAITIGVILLAARFLFCSRRAADVPPVEGGEPS